MATQFIAEDVASFSFEDFSVRAINRDGEIWFVATDIATVLSYRNAPDMTRVLDDDETDTHIMRIRSENGIEQNRKMTVINESGLYHAVLKSRKPEAKRFRKWVTSEVLPAIRKTGSYSVSKAQQGELATLIAERFPSGKDRPYAWSRFNNHFRLASYKDLPASHFEEACEYIKTMQDERPALPKPDTSLSLGLLSNLKKDKEYILTITNDGGLSITPVPTRADKMQELERMILDPTDTSISDDVMHTLTVACSTALLVRLNALRKECSK